MYLYKPYR
jgi:hypothetical protein